MISRTLRSLFVLMLPLTASAADWSWQWTPAPGEAAPTAEVCQFKYGKDWAYTVEIDDGPVSTLTVAQPLLAKYEFTDAPPGIPGGKPMPLVGGSAVIVGSVDTPNSTTMKWDGLRTLQSKGWGIINHSYSHQGRTWGTPPEILTPEQFRRDLFWSQAIFAAEVGGPAGHVPTSFVYPNGYTDYSKYLAEFGMQTGTRVGAADHGDAYSPKANWLDLDRTYLDEGPWSSGGKGKPMDAFPADPGPAAGRVFIDFTHGIDAKPESANQQRWAARLDTIAKKFGKAGRDNLWSASTGEIYEYVAARKQAKVKVESGKLTISLPDTIAGAALTVKLTGIKADTPLTAPPGATLYRKDNQVWLTTPLIGAAGAPRPKPYVKRIYAGPIKDLTWDKPVSLAAVRILQFGGVEPGFEMHLDAQAADGKTQSLIPPGQGKLPDAWGAWRLYDLIPNHPAIVATGLKASPGKSLHGMEVWVLDPAEGSGK